nr:uncharacterized protein LOC125621138 [Caretta caretta]
MACPRLLEKDIVTLCKKRGLSVGKFTKAELIVQLEEDDRSKEQIPDPNWGYSRIWEQLEWEPGIAKTPVPDQMGVFTIGFPIGGSRRTGLELSPREQEDHGRQREPEKELQKQQQHELAVVGRRGLGDLPRVSGDRSRGASSAGNLETKLLPLVKGGGCGCHLTAFEQAGDLNQGDPAEKPRCLAPLLGPKAIVSISQMGGEVDTLPLLTPTYISVWSFLGPGPSDPQWERKVMVDGETFLGWPDPETERTGVRPWVVQPQRLRACVSWVRVPGTKPLAFPMAQIPVQTQEEWGWLVVGVPQDTSC